MYFVSKTNPSPSSALGGNKKGTKSKSCDRQFGLVSQTKIAYCHFSKRLKKKFSLKYVYFLSEFCLLNF